MKYLLTIWGDEQGWQNQSPDESKKELDEYSAYGTEAADKGVFVGGEGLQPTSTATTVRVRGGERLITDGPFAETKEQLGGFYLLDCKDLDEAIEWAAKIPGARTGSIEIRPVIDYESMGAPEHGAAEARA